MPPCAGGGSVQVRERLFCPMPQVLEQADQSIPYSIDRQLQYEKVTGLDGYALKTISDIPVVLKYGKYD